VRKDGFLVEWKYGPPRLLIDNKPLDPKAEKMSQASLEFLSKLRYEIELSPDGEFKGLRNFDEIKKVGLKFADEMDRGITKKPGSAPIGDTMRAMIADRTILEAVLMKDIQILLFPLGKSFESKIPFEFEGELPNPFGGQALLTRGVISIKVTDRAKGIAAIQFEQSLSPDSLPIFLESFADWAKLPKPKGDALKNVAANVSDKATYIVDLKTGLPVSVSYSRAITVPGQEKGETHTFSATEK
jgi:hypothetical protein